MQSNHQSIDVSVVVIGRNEGVRLEHCLRSVMQANWTGVRHEVIYVDSRSTDPSVRTAEGLGAQALVLDDSHPCAAKARNLGWNHAHGEFILFLDGDTELHPEFVQHALTVLVEPKLCAVWGHRRESQPDQTIYNRLLDLDWVYPVGRTLYFGGDVLVRRAALAQVGGFDPSLKAGEEPELCARLRAAGWEIEHADVPMTRHDLAISSLRAYWLRAYRSGIAYAEVAHRAQVLGDVLWQSEARRDFLHGWVFLLSPILFLFALWLGVAFAGVFVLLALAFWIRTAVRSSWKAPGDWALCMQYAVHTHFQKIPALFGQMAWRRAAGKNRELAMIDYKANASGRSVSFKSALTLLLMPFAFTRRVVLSRVCKVWYSACLREGLGGHLDSSNVILGQVELHGTRNIRLGRNALIYPGVYLETQGAGSITLGDNVVLSRGVHIVAFDNVVIGDGAMLGEYTSVRDADHRLDGASLRAAGHIARPVVIGREVWLGRGVTVLKGVSVADHSVVGANAVVTKSVGIRQVVGGIPARVLRRMEPLSSPSL